MGDSAVVVVSVSVVSVVVVRDSVSVVVVSVVIGVGDSAVVVVSVSVVSVVVEVVSVSVVCTWVTSVWSSTSSVSGNWTSIIGFSKALGAANAQAQIIMKPIHPAKIVGCTVCCLSIFFSVVISKYIAPN